MLALTACRCAATTLALAVLALPAAAIAQSRVCTIDADCNDGDLCTTDVCKLTPDVCGDADSSGDVTSTDALRILSHATGVAVECALPRCDVDGNGRVTVIDSLLLLRYIAGLDTSLACGGTCSNAVLDCNDADPCTTDVCESDGEDAECRHFPLDCDDGIACTVDSCNVKNGCAHSPVDEVCGGTGGYCGAPLICDVSKGCVPSVPVCDDGNECTEDLCDATTDTCVHDALARLGAPCDDGLPCTSDEVCDGTGECASPAMIVDALRFEHGLVAGQILDTLFAADGAGPIHVRGENSALGAGINAAVVYDSSCNGGCSGRDADLGTPNEDFGGPGAGNGGAAGSPAANEVSRGNVLIVAENLTDTDDDGLVDVPADQSNVGVVLTFDFSDVAPVRVRQMTVVDLESSEPPMLVELFGRTGDLVASFTMPVTGDNGVLSPSLGPTDGVWSMTVSYGGSAAIDDIVFSPDVCPLASESTTTTSATTPTTSVTLLTTSTSMSASRTRGR